MSHDHDHAPTNYGKAFAIGVVLNLGFVLVEAFYGWQASSLALLADAAHNLSDVGGLLLAWAGFAAARLKPNLRHTYGWRRGSILASFANAILLLVAMGSLAWEAIQRMQTPAPMEAGTVMVVAGIGVIINTVTAWLFLTGSKGDLNIRGAFLHMAADALVSVGVVIAAALYPNSIRRHCPANTLADSSRLYSPAMARLTPLTMVETGEPSFSNCSAT
jgi:cobalt-zinc-cadmium efflux system protein